MSIRSCLSRILLSISLLFVAFFCLAQVEDDRIEPYEQTLLNIWTTEQEDTSALRLLWQSVNIRDPLVGDINLEQINKGLDIARKKQYALWEARLYDKLGCTYMFLSQKDDCEAALEKSMSLFESIGDTKNQVRVLQNLMSSYSANDAAEKALKLGYQAIDLCKIMEDNRCLGMTYFQLSKTMYNFDELEKGIEYTKKAVALLKNTDRTRFVVSCYSDFSQYGSYTYEESLAFIDTALMISIEDPNTTQSELARQYLEKVNMHQKFEQYGEAEKEFKYINEHLLDSVSIRLQQSIAMSKGENKYLLGRYEEAIAILKESVTDQHADINPFLNFDYEFIQMCYEELGQLDSAYKYHMILHEMGSDDRLHESKMKMKDVEAKYETEKKEMTISAQNQVIAKKNIIQWFALGTTLLLALLLFQMYRNAKQKKEAHDKLVELDDLKTRLYANITHEFRTPLTVIIGMASQIKENPSAFVSTGTDMIKRNGNRLLDLINQMLDLNKLESGSINLNYHQANIVQYLRNLSDHSSSYASSKEITVHFYPEEDNITMDFDEEKIQIVFSNLISNAIKFTPETGDIYIIARKHERASIPQLMIKIKDTGIGISEEELPFIFDRFYQADSSNTRQVEGSGIGLSLVREYIRLMKGEISVRSKLGVETEFTILLPITNKAPNKSYAFKPEVTLPINSKLSVESGSSIIQTTLQNALPNSRSTILLVEDNPDVVAYIASCLQSEYNFIVGKDGSEGIEIALQSIPDIIITDVMMPVKDGYEVCKTLKDHALTSHIPIIMLTARADQESKLTGLDKGADAYLSKPFDKEELLVRIKNLLQSRRKLQAYYSSISIASESQYEEIEKANIEDEFVINLKEIVNTELNNSDFSVEQFARRAGMSSTQFHRKVSAVTGHSPNRFIRHIRLNKAKNLLHTTDSPVNSIAYETGYNDPAYFSRVFKKEFGVTPLEWRQGGLD